MTFYDQAQSGNFVTGPAAVDSNGVPVRDVSATIQNSPPSAVIQIQQGVSIQVLPPSSVPRQVTVTNIGTVPLYFANVDPGPSIIDVLAYPGIGNYQFTINGSRLAAGATRQITTILPVYCFTRPVGGAGLLAINS